MTEFHLIRSGTLALLCATLVSCQGPDFATEPLEVGPVESFLTDVEPHLETRCATGGCHGRPDRPFRLFAKGAYRLNDTRTHLDEPLSMFEVMENALHVCGFAHAEKSARSLVLRKPLSQRAGGLWHGGGDVFESRSDPAYQAIFLWLEKRAPLERSTP